MKNLMNYLLQHDVVIFFDVDGVLAPYEFGKHRHCIADEEWDKMLENGGDAYSIVSPIKLFQDFIKEKGTDNVYVCSKAHPEEYASKTKFCQEGYGIPSDHIFLVASKKEKLDIPRNFAITLDVPEEKIVMVEDTIETLDLIAKCGNFSTVHVSSFFAYNAKKGAMKTSKLNWEIIHECDDEDGNPTQWVTEINHTKYGKYCWINDMGDYFGVEVDYGGFIELAKCKSLPSAKRWVTTQLTKR